MNWRRVTLNFKDSSLLDILSVATNMTSRSYRFEGNNIIITEEILRLFTTLNPMLNQG